MLRSKDLGNIELVVFRVGSGKFLDVLLGRVLGLVGLRDAWDWEAVGGTPGLC